jgi:pyrroline-5-carboxylate reductase
MAKKKVLVIGAGSMGGALVRGMVAAHREREYEINACDQHPKLLKQLSELECVATTQDSSAIAKKADVIILCVKPHDLTAAVEPFAGKIRKDCLVISFLAGITIDDIAKATKFSGDIVRAMPNIAANVRLAATGMAASTGIDASRKKLAEHILASVGDVHWLKESLLDAVTGLSGSGPAYIYMVIEAMTDGGVKMGIPRDLSLQMSIQTVLGAATLVKETGVHPAVLRDQVTTPGGTTIHAIHELEERGLRAMIISAIATATERSQALRKKV